MKTDSVLRYEAMETPFQTDDGDQNNSGAGNTTLPQTDERDNEPSIGIYTSDNDMSWVRLDEGIQLESSKKRCMSLRLKSWTML